MCLVKFKKIKRLKIENIFNCCLGREEYKNVGARIFVSAPEVAGET